MMTTTVKSRKKSKTAGRNAPDEEWFAGAISIRKSLFFPSHEPRKKLKKAPFRYSRAERSLYENRSAKGAKDHGYFL